MGLQETTINNTHLTEYDIGIKELFIFNCEGSVILTTSFTKNYVKNYNDCIQFYVNIRHLKIKEYCNIVV